MRRALLPLLLCTSLPGMAVAQERASKPQVSVDGVYSIRFVEHADGSCDVEVEKEQTQAWSLSKCVGTPDDLYFPSQDGERFWMLKTLGEKPKKGAWTSSVVAVLYGRDGQVLRRKTLSELVPRASWRVVRQLVRHFKWLEGVAGVPGKGPRLNEKSQVEFEVIGGKNHKLPF